MRMELPTFGRQSGALAGGFDLAVQPRQFRRPADTGPQRPHAPLRGEAVAAADREVEGGHRYARQQAVDIGGGPAGYLADEAQGHMHVFRRDPAGPRQRLLQGGKPLAQRVGQAEGDEQADQRLPRGGSGQSRNSVSTPV